MLLKHKARLWRRRALDITLFYQGDVYGRIRFDGIATAKNLYVIWILWPAGIEVKWQNPVAVSASQPAIREQLSTKTFFRPQSGNLRGGRDSNLPLACNCQIVRILFFSDVQRRECLVST
jgi:hypothetical protein